MSATLIVLLIPHRPHLVCIMDCVVQWVVPPAGGLRYCWLARLVALIAPPAGGEVLCFVSDVNGRGLLLNLEM